MENSWLWYYFGIINLISGVIFIIDKNAAINSRRRVPEQTLHVLEFLGGVFVIFILMYALPHKGRKFTYYMWTWVIIVWWIIILLIFNFDFMSWTFAIKKH